ncbi:MAG: hypothetical protein AAF405_03785 [Pseudomonadota bacterium]
MAERSIAFHLEDVSGARVHMHLNIVAPGIFALDFPEVPSPLEFNLFDLDDAIIEGDLPDPFDPDIGSTGRS